MKKIIIISVALLLINTGCKPSGSDNARDWARKIGNKVCAKMGECTEEMMKTIPKAARNRAMANMFTEEKCLANMKKEQAEDDVRLAKIRLTPEEIKLAEACLKEIAEASCRTMGQKKADSCEKLGKVFDARPE